MVAKQKNPAPVPVERITQSILMLRGHKVLLDADLAAMYGVETKVPDDWGWWCSDWYHDCK